MMIKQMQKTKIIIALVAIAAITLTIVGLASAQISANQNYTNPITTPNPVAPNNGFWGWIGNCFGLRSNQPYPNQYITPQAPANTTVPAPYQPYQGGYYGYGYGRCRAGW